MYRQYEDPWELQDRLEEAKQKLEEAKHMSIDGKVDADYLVALYEDVEELRERVNFAWQDQEYDAEYEYGEEY